MIYSMGLKVAAGRCIVVRPGERRWSQRDPTSSLLRVAKGICATDCDAAGIRAWPLPGATTAGKVPRRERNATAGVPYRAGQPNGWGGGAVEAGGGEAFIHGGVGAHEPPDEGG